MPSCFELLGLDDTATEEDVAAAWRKLRSAHHPDKGGGAEMFNTLKRAYDECLAVVHTPKTCAECGGKGRINYRVGFNRIDMMCELCNGTGER